MGLKRANLVNNCTEHGDILKELKCEVGTYSSDREPESRLRIDSDHDNSFFRGWGMKPQRYNSYLFALGPLKLYTHFSPYKEPSLEIPPSEESQKARAARASRQNGGISGGSAIYLLRHLSGTRTAVVRNGTVMGHIGHEEELPSERGVWSSACQGSPAAPRLSPEMVLQVGSGISRPCLGCLPP